MEETLFSFRSQLDETVVCSSLSKFVPLTSVREETACLEDVSASEGLDLSEIADNLFRFKSQLDVTPKRTFVDRSEYTPHVTTYSDHVTSFVRVEFTAPFGISASKLFTANIPDTPYWRKQAHLFPTYVSLITSFDKYTTKGYFQSVLKAAPKAALSKPVMRFLFFLTEGKYVSMFLDAPSVDLPNKVPLAFFRYLNWSVAHRFYEAYKNYWYYCPKDGPTVFVAGEPVSNGYLDFKGRPLSNQLVVAALPKRKLYEKQMYKIAESVFDSPEMDSVLEKAAVRLIKSPQVKQALSEVVAEQSAMAKENAINWMSDSIKGIRDRIAKMFNTTWELITKSFQTMCSAFVAICAMFYGWLKDCTESRYNMVVSLFSTPGVDFEFTEVTESDVTGDEYTSINSTYEPQGLGIYTLAADAVTCALSFLTSAAAMIPLVGTVAAFFSGPTIKNFFKEVTPIMNGLNVVKDGVKKISDFLYFMVTGDHLFDEYDLMDKITEVIKEAEFIQKEHTTALSEGRLPSLLLAQRCKVLSLKLAELVTKTATLSPGGNGNTGLMTYNLQRSLQSTIASLNTIASSVKTRPVPVYLGFESEESGVGKSKAAEVAIPMIHKRYKELWEGKIADQQFPYPDPSVFNVNCTDSEEKYSATGYTNQFAARFEEIGTTKDSNLSYACWNKVRSYVDEASMPLTAADLAGKGNTWFTTPLLVTTSNGSPITDMKSPAAFFRRLHYHFMVSLKEGLPVTTLDQRLSALRFRISSKVHEGRASSMASIPPLYKFEVVEREGRPSVKVIRGGRTLYGYLCENTPDEELTILDVVETVAQQMMVFATAKPDETKLDINAMFDFSEVDKGPSEPELDVDAMMGTTPTDTTTDLKGKGKDTYDTQMFRAGGKRLYKYTASFFRAEPERVDPDSYDLDLEDEDRVHYDFKFLVALRDRIRDVIQTPCPQALGHVQHLNPDKALYIYYAMQCHPEASIYTASSHWPVFTTFDALYTTFSRSFSPNLFYTMDWITSKRFNECVAEWYGTKTISLRASAWEIFKTLLPIVAVFGAIYVATTRVFNALMSTFDSEAVGDSRGKGQHVPNTKKSRSAKNVEAYFNRKHTFKPQSGFSTTAAKVTKNVRIIMKDGAFCSFALALGGTVYVANRHVFLEKKQLNFASAVMINMVTHEQTTFESNKGFQLIAEYPLRDLVVFSVSNLSQNPRIKNLYLRSEYEAMTLGMTSMFARPEFVVEPEARWEMIVAQGGGKSRAPIYTSDTGDKLSGYLSVLMKGSPGDCGLPYTHCSRSDECHVIGIHAGSNMTNAIVTPLFAEEATEWIQKAERLSKHVQMDFDDNELCTYDPHSSVISVSVMNNPTNKTVLLPTVFKALPGQYDRFAEVGITCDVAPAVQNREAYLLAREKQAQASARTKVHPDVVALIQELDCWLLDGYISDTTSIAPCRVLTPEEAISGTSDADGIKIDSFDLSTASGITLKHHGFKKSDVAVEGPARAFVVAETNLRLAEMRKGVFRRQMNADCLKDELRDLDRVEAKKTRLFNVTDFIDNLLLKCILGMIIVQCKGFHMLSACSVGINAYSAQWNTIMSSLLSIGQSDTLVATDISGFDISIPPCFVLPIVNFLYRFGKFRTADYPLIYWAIYSCFHATRFAWKDGYFLNQGNTSGNYITSFLNTLVNYCMFHVVFLLSDKVSPSERFQGIYRQGSDLQHYSFSKAVCLFLYSDDNVSNACPHIHWSNTVISEGFMKYFGIVCTAPDKSLTIPEYYSPEELEFLSRGFKDIGGFYVAPLKLDSLFGQLFYVRCPGKNQSYATEFNRKQLAINVENVLRELTLHGESGLHYRRALIQACDEYRVPLNRSLLIETEQYEKYVQSLIG